MAVKTDYCRVGITNFSGNLLKYFRPAVHFQIGRSLLKIFACLAIESQRLSTLLQELVFKAYEDGDQNGG